MSQRKDFPAPTMFMSNSKSSKPFKFGDFTAQEIIDHFKGKMPLQGDDLSDCIAVLKKAFKAKESADISAKYCREPKTLLKFQYFECDNDTQQFQRAQFYMQLITFIEKPCAGSPSMKLGGKDKDVFFNIKTDKFPNMLFQILKSYLSIYYHPSQYYENMSLLTDEQMLQGMKTEIALLRKQIEKIQKEFTIILNMAWKLRELPVLLKLEEHLDWLCIHSILHWTTEFEQYNEYETMSIYASVGKDIFELKRLMYTLTCVVYPEFIKEGPVILASTNIDDINKLLSSDRLEQLKQAALKKHAYY